MAFCAVADDEALELGGNEDDITDMLAGVENAVCDADVDRRASEADTDGETDTDDADVSAAVCVVVVELVGRADLVTGDDAADAADVVAGTEYVGDVDVVGFGVTEDEDVREDVELALAEPVLVPVAEADALEEGENDRVRVRLSVGDIDGVADIVSVAEVVTEDESVREAVSVPVIERELDRVDDGEADADGVLEKVDCTHEPPLEIEYTKPDGQLGDIVISVIGKSHWTLSHPKSCTVPAGQLGAQCVPAANDEREYFHVHNR